MNNKQTEAREQYRKAVKLDKNNLQAVAAITFPGNRFERLYCT